MESTNSDKNVAKIAQLTGVAFNDVHKIIDAQTDFLVAVDLAPEAYDGQRSELRAKYPDLLRESVVRDLGTKDNPVDYELEATITQLQSGMPAKAVTDVLATFCELCELVSPSEAAEYRAWAKEWAS